MIIYKLTCRITRKAYIGATTKTLDERWVEHCAAAKRNVKTKLYSAIRKYGRDSWDMEILASNISDLSEMFSLEQKMICENNTFSNGYNMTIGGDGLLGLSRTGEHQP